MCNSCESETIIEHELCAECLEKLPECEECGNKIPEDKDTFSVCGNEYCEDCFHDLPYCNHCEETVLETNEHNICSDCDRNYCSCINCNDYVLSDDCLLDSNDDPVCESCQEEGCIPYDDSSWYPYDDLTYRDGEHWLNPPSRTIELYHNGNKEKILGSNSGRYVGFELEMVPKENRFILAEEIISLENFICEEDGSLYDIDGYDDEDSETMGFEAISNYGDLDVILKLAEELCDTISGKAISHDGKGCGLHVHVTKSSNYTTAKMICFWNDPENEDFIREFARRASHFASKDSDKCIKNFEENNYDWYCEFDGKYNIVNVTDRTVEVRAFRGTTKKERLLACIELSYYTHEYCKGCSTVTDLTWKKFMEWLPEESVWIKPYLVSRNFKFEDELVCA